MLVPIGASSSVAVSSVTTARNTSAAPAPMPGASSGSVTRRSMATGPAPSDVRDVVEHRRGLRQRGPLRHDGPRQEEDRVRQRAAGRSSGRAGSATRRVTVTRASATTMPGSALPEVGAALDERADAARGGGRQPGHRQGEQRGEDGRGDPQPDAGAGRGGELGAPGTPSTCPRAASAAGCPAARRAPAPRQLASASSAGTRAPGPAAPARATRAAPLPTRAYRRAAAQPQLGQQQQQAAQHEHAGQRVGGRPVEGRLVLVVDGGGEGREAQQLQRAELGEQVQRRRAAPPPSSAGRSCGSTTRANVAPRAVPERAGGLLQRRVEPAQRRRDRQVDEREVRQGHDQQRAAVPLDARGQRHPAEAVDERRDGQRRDQQHVPEPPAPGSVGALDQPGRRRCRAPRTASTQRHRAAGRCWRAARRSAGRKSRRHSLGPAERRPPTTTTNRAG